MEFSCFCYITCFHNDVSWQVQYQVCGFPTILFKKFFILLFYHYLFYTTYHPFFVTFRPSHYQVNRIPIYFCRPPISQHILVFCSSYYYESSLSFVFRSLISWCTFSHIQLNICCTAFLLFLFCSYLPI